MKRKNEYNILVGSSVEVEDNLNILIDRGVVFDVISYQITDRQCSVLLLITK